jgi:hypothetical protein
MIDACPNLFDLKANLEVSRSRLVLALIVLIEGADSAIFRD